MRRALARSQSHSWSKAGLAAFETPWGTEAEWSRYIWRNSDELKQLWWPSWLLIKLWTGSDTQLLTIFCSKCSCTFRHCPSKSRGLLQTTSMDFRSSLRAKGTHNASRSEVEWSWARWQIVTMCQSRGCYHGERLVQPHMYQAQGWWILCSSSVANLSYACWGSTLKQRCVGGMRLAPESAFRWQTHDMFPSKL